MHAAIAFDLVDASQARPVVAGTDIKVSQIAREAERMGMTVSEILEAHPHLTAPQVRAALAYYDAHRAEIHGEWSEADELVNRLQRSYS